MCAGRRLARSRTRLLMQMKRRWNGLAGATRVLRPRESLPGGFCGAHVTWTYLGRRNRRVCPVWVSAGDGGDNKNNAFGRFAAAGAGAAVSAGAGNEKSGSRLRVAGCPVLLRRLPRVFGRERREAPARLACKPVLSLARWARVCGAVIANATPSICRRVCLSVSNAASRANHLYGSCLLEATRIVDGSRNRRPTSYSVGGVAGIRR